ISPPAWKQYFCSGCDNERLAYAITAGRLLSFRCEKDITESILTPRQRLTEQSVEVVQPAAVVEENGAVEESGGQEKSVAPRLLLTRVHVAGRLLLTLSTSLVGDRVGRAPSKRKALRSMSEDGSGEGGDPRKRCSVMVGMSGAQATLAFALASALEDLSNGAQKRKHTSSEMFIEGEELFSASSEVSTDAKEDSGAHGAAKTNVETENGAEMDVDEKVVEKKNRHRFVTVRFQHYHHHQQQQQTLTNTPP
ncbi:conserved hypothetical protein, partial [Trichinella spiralis]|uniref:hypothetical protein n=1 Tax=Trichinella spiralis TaxID=6334 RepID=UPI0001EFDC4F